MRNPLVLLAAAPLAVVLSACGATAGGDGSKPRLVASFYPFAYVAQQVGGSFVEVSTLTSPGVEPHDLELKPRQVGSVQDADLVVYQKGFQPAVDAAVGQAGRSADDTVDVASLVTLKAATPAAGQSPGQPDPHTWLDPNTMIGLAKAVSVQLSRLDPAHRASYADNADKLISALRGLDHAFTSGLATCRTRTVVTSHAAFQYLADRYDLDQVPIAGIDPSNEPSPSQLRDIITLVRAKQITTIFTEELVSPAVARTIASEAGVSTATLDPIEGLSATTKGETYLTLMRHNLDSLRKANTCS